MKRVAVLALSTYLLAAQVINCDLNPPRLIIVWATNQTDRTYSAKATFGCCGATWYRIHGQSLGTILNTEISSLPLDVRLYDDACTEVAVIQGAAGVRGFAISNSGVATVEDNYPGDALNPKHYGEAEGCVAVPASP